MSESKEEAPGPASELLTTAQACARLNVSKPTLYAWARKHRVRRVKEGRLVRWPVSELERMVRKSTKQLR